MSANKTGIVMVVEDYDDTRELLRECLQMMGYRVIEATNGRQAVEIAFTERPDLILMDLSMPVMDGIAATLEIHAQAETQNVPIVALSAHCGQSDWSRKALAAGCLECIGKPVELETLDRLVNRFVPN
ncbi:MAG: response regulator [Pyrinomonadaceae bacterium]